MDTYGEGTWMEICVGEVRMRLGFVLYFTGEIFGEVRMCLGFECV